LLNDRQAARWLWRFFMLLRRGVVGSDSVGFYIHGKLLVKIRMTRDRQFESTLLALKRQ